MPKITASDIKDLGFTGAMFRKSIEVEFDLFLESVIAEQALILEGRIGAAYAIATSPQKDYIKLAEKYLAATELMSRRITVLCENAVGSAEKPLTTDEAKQRDDYSAKAESWIAKIAAGATSDGQDFACGAVITDHFGGN